MCGVQAHNSCITRNKESYKRCLIGSKHLKSEVGYAVQHHLFGSRFTRTKKTEACKQTYSDELNETLHVL